MKATQLMSLAHPCDVPSLPTAVYSYVEVAKEMGMFHYCTTYIMHVQRRTLSDYKYKRENDFIKYKFNLLNYFFNIKYLIINIKCLELNK